jgi:hypothetical protein
MINLLRDPSSVLTLLVNKIYQEFTAISRGDNGAAGGFRMKSKGA